MKREHLPQIIRKQKDATVAEKTPIKQKLCIDIFQNILLSADLNFS
jgi:type III secretory pathway component EscU